MWGNGRENQDGLSNPSHGHNLSVGSFGMDLPSAVFGLPSPSSPASWRQILGVISQGTSNKVWSIGDHVRYIPRTVGLNYIDREPTTTEIYSLRP